MPVSFSSLNFQLSLPHFMKLNCSDFPPFYILELFLSNINCHFILVQYRINLGYNNLWGIKGDINSIMNIEYCIVIFSKD